VTLVSAISINEAFAVEYKDDTGYIPKWAIALDQRDTLDFCGFITTPGQDYNWCTEFGAYVNQQFNSQQPSSPTDIPIVNNQISDKGQQSTDLITLYYTLDGIFSIEQNSGPITLIINGKVNPPLFKDPDSIQRVKISISNTNTSASPQLTTKGGFSATIYPDLILGETYKIQVEYRGQTVEKLFKFDESHITRKPSKSQTTQSSNSEWDVQEKVNKELKNEKNKLSGKAVILVYSNTYWSGTIANGDGSSSTKDGGGDAKYVAYCGSLNLVQGLIQKQTAEGFVTVVIIQNGKIIGTQSTTAAYGIAHATGECLSVLGGGCLIATATYGTELAPQVQQLRELRDNSLLQTESGTSFMRGFNQFYYSFSPTIADWERENPAFKEFVKITLTPMISSLSLLNYVDMDSESNVLGYGISLILLNVGMYFVAPAVVIHTIKKKF